MGDPQTTIRRAIDDLATPIAAGRLTTRALSRIMTAHFGGTDASGAWSWRMAYDLMQGATVAAMLRDNRVRPSAAHLRHLMELTAALPTETRRSEHQIRLQQFSTPLPYAFVAARAAAPRAGDRILEPSAGTGAMLAAPHLRGLNYHLNEIDPFRARILAAIYGHQVTGHDAEFIDDLLPTDLCPSVILMNPPFSSSVDRSQDRQIAAKHLISAAKRLAPGGRLVAILPMGFTPARQGAFWQRLTAIVTPRVAIHMPGAIYRKMGTSVETQLLICDKIAPDDFGFLRVEATSLKAALNIVHHDLPPRGAPPEPPHPTPKRPQPPTAPPASFAPPASSAPETRRQSGSGVIKTPGGANGSADLRPVAYDSLDTPRENPPVSEVYARYAPQRIAITDAVPHPTPLVESIPMASVVPPVPTTHPRLPAKIITTGLLSDAQLETLLMVDSAHSKDLPGRFILDADQTTARRSDDDPKARAYRQGAALGDGAGCGKGRQVAGLILANWLSGRTRAIWVSKSATLIEDAIRDWRDLGGAPTDIHALSKWKLDQDIPLASGILFVTYATLRSVGRAGRSRLDQILAWAGADFDGVIAFDEAHAMANAAGGTSETGSGAGSRTRARKPSQQGRAGLRLQLAVPRARVLYVSATGATEMRNLAYAARLGLWGEGPGYAFPSRDDFVSSMEAGGVAAMEVVARDLKSLGLFSARALSFDGIEYDIAEHRLTPDQIAIYDSFATAFKTIHQNLDRALEATGIVDPDGGPASSGGKAAAKSRFEGLKQRFCNHLILGMKAQSVIAAIEADIAAGWAPVIQIVSTGESLLKRRLDALGPDDNLHAGSLTPREYILTYLEAAFPIHAHKQIEAEDGTIITEPLRDKNGALVISREAEALRDAMIEDLMCLAPIASALDQILWHFGADTVAEITGRSIRPLKGPDGAIFIEKRGATANSADTAAFMSGQKSILIFSDAGGTGRSYHAAQTAQNQKRRRHYLLEPGWRADAAIQGLGRTHRAAQVSAPFIRVCTSDVHGEKRFTASICRRLGTLGAITKGARETGAQGLFRPEDNLESPIARASLRALFADLAAGQARSMSYDTFTEWTALRLIDKDGVMLEELPPIQRFLNRVLALPVAMQNALFAEFTEKIAIQTERARLAGTLDRGIELLRGDRITQTDSATLRICPDTGAITRIVALTIETRRVIATAAAVLADHASAMAPMINIASGGVALISSRPVQVYEEDTVRCFRRLIRPDRQEMMEETRFAQSQWEPAGEALFRERWTKAADALPKTIEEHLNLLTGLLLPIWKQVPSRNERIYRVTPDNAPQMIGRALNDDQAAAVRAQFMTGTPKTPADIVARASGTTAPVDLGAGLTLSRRRVAGTIRLEIDGADRATITFLKSIGCFTEIIAYQLRVFVPHGDGADPEGIVAKIVGPACVSDAA